MIIEKSHALQEKLRTLHQLERRQSEIKDIDATYQQLRENSTKVQRLVQQYGTVNQYLSDAGRRDLIALFQTLYEKTQELATDFSTNSNQARKLKAFGDKTVVDCINAFEDMWAASVAHEVSSERDIYLLVKNLPDVRANGTKVEGILQRLEAFRKNPPSTEDELADYLSKVESLRSQIESIRGLTDAIQSFLQKMANNTATIADLTPEILDWCHEQSRAEHFIIRFAEGR